MSANVSVAEAREVTATKAAHRLWTLVAMLRSMGLTAAEVQQLHEVGLLADDDAPGLASLALHYGANFGDVRDEWESKRKTGLEALASKVSGRPVQVAFWEDDETGSGVAA
ncbi:hypothetical protein [Georgenia yuyongxinii]|uniref:Uncharacterized protein n=1 Tax=Georgenia yuyongxinii TaxID=2589797 RepID=A0A552WV11_9MICO|nr:hypothetical protein [Georgenia yuyongxinii]TRW46399.1 hypothetical protein FJ693_05585 [Georgenia yuyongxinii]